MSEHEWAALMAVGFVLLLVALELIIGALTR